MDSNGRTFEDVVPPHRMVRETLTHTLSVDLSALGYKKEHIKVQLVHSHRRLIVRGERPVAGNRWSRFRLEFKLPDDCNTSGIQARFEKGVVRVTMPGLTPVTVLEEPADAAAAASGVQAGAERQEQDGDRAAPPAGGGGKEPKKDQETTEVQKKEEASQQRASSAKDGSEGGAATAAGAPSRQGFALLQDRKKMATTVLGVVLVLISLGIYVRYSLAP